MAKLRVAPYLAGMALVGLGVAMAVTNPGEAAYRDYAARRLTQQLQENECVKLDASYRDLCKLLDREQGQTLLKRLVDDNTERQNYLLFSLYKTSFSTNDVLPSFLSGLLSLPEISYQTESIGVFGQFQIYRVDKQQS
ncbi:MAG: DUF4359 domain-containing protein [Pegethrix bostrychoides GSE-TBD4-15B]|uniref:DUF4359 domain-containing protein n=1 Tax=Pegethrix bostrychoides GSE-TBD4-15B TaxID=2839662 RepID=A0A951U4G8_9CYAN|nr:DUF4359 domain-containing protein [Pegethrix bostrychoides GSE-TBD4-15B]